MLKKKKKKAYKTNLCLGLNSSIKQTKLKYYNIFVNKLVSTKIWYI
jgi:hypothetical protein